MRFKCTDCSLYNQCNTNFISSGGDDLSKIMVVLDAPDRDQDSSNNLLNGDTYKKLQYFFEKAGINIDKVYFTTAMRCKPYTLTGIKKKNILACRKYLIHEIMTKRPRVIITMGKYAHWVLSNEESLAEFRGHFGQVSIAEKDGEANFTYIPTFSAYTSLYEWKLDDYIIHDLKKAKKFYKEQTIELTQLPNYTVVDNLKKLKLFYETMMDNDFKYVTSDFETTGLKFYKNTIINVGYCTSNNDIFCVPLDFYEANYIKSKKWNDEEKEYAIHLNKFFTQNSKKVIECVRKVNAKPNTKWVFHNGKFDYNFAKYHKIPFGKLFFDTLLADSLIDENKYHSLNMAMEYRDINFGAYDTKLWPYVGKKTKKSYKWAPPQIIFKYLAIDVYGDKLLFQKQVQELKEENLLDHFMKVKMPSLRHMMEVEYRGCQADLDLINETDTLLKDKILDIQKKARDFTKIEDFNLGSPKQVVDYMTEQGFPFARLGIKKNKTGYSTDKESLLKFKKYKKYRELPSLILQYKALTKLAGTYVAGKVDRKPDEEGGMLKHIASDGRIKANWNLWSAKTGRFSCFAKGTPIEILRDIRKFPKGVPIEKVKIGDLAYTYNSKGKLTLKKVVNTYKNPKQQLYRLYWASSSGRVGYVDVTKNHKFRTYNRGYVEAENLKMGEKLFFMSRRKKGSGYAGYASIMFKNKPSGITEHRFIFETLKGKLKKGYNIHHLDHDHLNNNPDNLIQMEESEHRSYHAKINADRDSHKIRSSNQLKERWKNDRESMLQIMSGENNGGYKDWSKLDILKIIMKSGCRTKYTDHDYYTIIRYLEKHGIDYKKIQDRFTHTGEFLNSNRIRSCLNKTYKEAKKELKIGQNKWVRLRNEFLMETNHCFVALEKLEGRYEEVYDLEIEDTHNYIAGELCAHNCNQPSLQVWPRPIPDLPNIRNFIKPRNENYVIWSADYSQLEINIVAALSKDKNLIRKIQDGVDIHCDNAIGIGRSLGVTNKDTTYEYIMTAVGKGDEVENNPFKESDIPDELKTKLKQVRTYAKGLGFGLNYGKGAKTFAEEFGLELHEAEDMIVEYFKEYYGMKNWRDKLVEMGFERGYITLLSGRKRRVKPAVDWLKSPYSKGVWSAQKLQGEIERQLMNYPVQGGAHEVFEPAQIRLSNRFKKDKIRAYQILSIHDDITGECHIDDMQKVKQAILEEMPTVFHKGTKYEVQIKVDVDFFRDRWYGEKIKI